jgi:hypothetical protein
MNPVDYTPVLLAQITDLQMRVTNQDAVITALKSEVERLTGHSLNVKTTNTVKTSVPLMPRPNMRGPRPPMPTTNNTSGAISPSKTTRTRPKVASEKPERPTLNMSDIINNGEQVTIKIRTSSGDGNPTFTYAFATFDGTDFTVTKCELAPSLVNMKTSKPGEILYKFMNELKDAGHLTRTFSIAPWRLCSVERNGVTKTLEELRNVIG